MYEIYRSVGIHFPYDIFIICYVLLLCLFTMHRYSCHFFVKKFRFILASVLLFQICFHKLYSDFFRVMSRLLVLVTSL